MPASQSQSGSGSGSALEGVELSCSALPAGAEVVQLVAREALSEPYEIELDVVVADHNLVPGDLLGQPMAVRFQIRTNEDGSEFELMEFQGFIARFDYYATHDAMAIYRAVLRPGLWFLDRTADCRIFQNLNVPGILAELFGDHADLITFRDDTAGTYRVREYCVQYRESAFAFVSRLMEEEGIHYYFTHNFGANTHTLVLTDGDGPEDSTAVPTLTFWEHGNPSRGEAHFTDWVDSGEVVSGHFTLDDYEFTTPSTDLTCALNTDRSHPHADLEVYDYPGGYSQTSDGDHYVAARKQRSDTAYLTMRAATHTGGVRPGRSVTTEKLPCGDGTFLLTRANHHLQVPTHDRAGGGGADEYSCEFEGIDQNVPFLPPRLTPKPFIRGPQTAEVVGPSGDEIYTDDDGYGRVKVQFHWDREGANDENSSCWVRVAQIWAGAGWGAQFLPRIGHEVVVGFLEGDPDRPLITGSVYNADNMPPYALPTNKTQSGIKSRSSTGGDAETFNELRFEDKTGEEEVYFHAEKNFKRVVENNDELTVGLEKCDPGDQTITVYNDQNVTVQNGNQTITVELGNQTIGVDTGNQDITVGQGNHTLTVTAGTSTTEAGQSIELKVGSNSIKIDNMGITLKATMITLDASTVCEVKGGAMVKIQGGMVTIN